MKIDASWLAHAGTQALCEALEAAGHQALFVGGCVRNALLGEAVSDVDMACDARPEVTTAIAEAMGFKVVPTGIDHGTVTVIAKGAVHEITTFRRDVETNGRHAVIAYSPRIEDDAARRDFTMNALYADRRGLVIDPLGGLGDLQARHLRFVGDADARIREDYLRILRFFRFYAQYGDPAQGIDPDGLAACAANADGIAELSKERIGAEMRKLLGAGDPAPALAAMQATGVLARILQGADPKGIAPLVHLEDQSGRAPRWLCRLAVLGGDGDYENLRLSRHEGRDIGLIRDDLGSMRPPAILGYALGEDLAWDVMLARAVLFEQPLAPHIGVEIARGAQAVFPVKAKDLMPELQGAELGRKLKALEAAWLAADLRATREELLA